MVRQRRTEGTEEAGRRLESYIKARWSRKQGGMQSLASASSTTKETLYNWFRGDYEPNLSTLGLIAEQLGVRRVDLVAALDGVELGETPPPASDRLRALEVIVNRLLAEVPSATPAPGAPRATKG